MPRFTVFFGIDNKKTVDAQNVDDALHVFRTTNPIDQVIGITKA